MDSLKMLEQYKNAGDRVDEVLFYAVAKELGRLREIIDQKNFSIDLIGEQKLDAQKENTSLRKTLNIIADKTYVGEGYEYADQVANNLISIARKALEGGEIN